MTDMPAGITTGSPPGDRADKTERPDRHSAVSDFGIDTTSRSTGEAISDYLARVRGGELGSLPALLGLVTLVVVFSVLSGDFLTLGNVANLLAQGAGTTVIAMGLVFV